MGVLRAPHALTRIPSASTPVHSGMTTRPNGYAGIAILLSMLIAIGIALYLFVAPVKTQNPNAPAGQQGTTSYLGQIQQTRQTGNRMAAAQQSRSVAQMVTIIEINAMNARSAPQDTFALLDAFRADGSYGMLAFDSWNAPNPATPPIVYVPQNSRGTSGILFYEHPDNHDGAGGHIAYDGGGVQWYEWNEFVNLTGNLPQPTW